MLPPGSAHLRQGAISEDLSAKALCVIHALRVNRDKSPLCGTPLPALIFGGSILTGERLKATLS